MTQPPAGRPARENELIDGQPASASDPARAHEPAGASDPASRGSSRRIAAVRLVASFALALAVWLAAGVLWGDGYSRAHHIGRAASVLVGVLAGWALIGRLTGGLRRPRAADVRWALVGAASYLLPTVAAMALVVGTGVATLTVHRDAVAIVGQGLLLLALVLVYEAIPEELVYRELAQTSLRTLAGPWVAIAGQAALFVGVGVAIGAARTPDRLVLFAVFSLVLGVIRQVAGSVGATMGFHAAFQLVVQWILGGYWDAFGVSDPELWFAGAVTLPAAVLGPVIVRVAAGRERSDARG